MNNETKSQLDYVMSKWEMTPLKDIITPENEFWFSDREEGDYSLKCKTCGIRMEFSPREIMRLHDCYYCVDIAHHIASQALGSLGIIKNEHVQNAVAEFRDFLTSIINLISMELEVPQRTYLLPSFNCLSELFYNNEIVGCVDSSFVGDLIEAKHNIVVSLIVDLLAWIEETEHLVGADNHDYPLPWRNDLINQIRIERAISTIEKLRKRAIAQRLWIKNETGFTRISPNELPLTPPSPAELSEILSLE